MKESHRKDLATNPDPESCDSGRKAAGEALTGAHAGQPSSCVITVSGVPTLSTQAEGNTVGGATGKPSADLAQSKTLRPAYPAESPCRSHARGPSGSRASTCN